MTRAPSLARTGLFLAACYFCAALFAQSLTPTPGGIVPVWPAAGFAFAAFMQLGICVAPLLFLADLASSTIVGVPLNIALALSASNTVAIFLGASLAQQQLQSESPFSDAKRMGLFLLTGPALAAVIAAPLGVSLLIGIGSTQQSVPDAVWSWLLADYTGIVIVTPFVEAWRRHRLSLPPIMQRLEGWGLLLCAAIVTWLVFGIEHAYPLNLYPLPFAYIPVIAWATFRADSRTLTLILALIFPFSCLCTAAGLGPFGQYSPPLPLHLLQVFSTVTSVTTMIIHALNKERSQTFASLKENENALRESRDELERRVHERTSKLQETLEELRNAEETYRTLFENASEGIYRADVSGSFVRVNPGFAKMLGYASPIELKDKIKDISRQIFANPDDRARLYEQLSRFGQAKDFEVLMRKRDGAQIWTLLSVRPVIGKNGTILGTEGIVQDITQRKLSEEELQRRATIDPLTGAANRMHFERTFATWAAQAKRSGSGLGLLFLDLDDFKQVNDQLGHQAGDSLLTQVVERINTRMRESDMLARIGGDEFALLLHNLSSKEKASVIADDIVSALSSPFEYEGNEIRIGVSIGGSLYPEGGTSLEALMKSADKAMYKAKQRGKNRHSIE